MGFVCVVCRYAYIDFDTDIVCIGVTCGCHGFGFTISDLWDMASGVGVTGSGFNGSVSFRKSWCFAYGWF